MKTSRYMLGLLYSILKVLSFQYYISTKRHRKSNAIIAIYFHKLSERRFRKIIRWIKRNRFQLLSQDQVIDFLYNGKEVRGGIWMTTDDGWSENYKLLPLIEEDNVPLTIFLTTSPVFTNGVFWTGLYERQTGKRTGPEFHKLEYQGKIDLIHSVSGNSENNRRRESLTEEEIRILGRHPLISLGLHTHNHVSVVNCTDSEIEEELRENNAVLKTLCKGEIKSFAYPFGITDRSYRHILEKFNVKLAVSTGNRRIQKGSDPYMLPRYGIWEASMVENYCRLLDCWRS